jgi:GntR family transcriptional repressor for pyruvate dehydrogenase complex
MTTKRADAVPVSALGSRPRRANATAEIAEALRASMANGELPHGARLPRETALARHFGVSLPTVREALRILQTMGLIEIRHGSGTYVIGDPQPFVAASLQTLLQMKGVTLLDVLDLRQTLATSIARRVVRNATDDDIEQLAVLEQDLRAVAQTADRYEEVAQVALRFHIAFSAAARDPLPFAIDRFLAELLIRLSVRGLEDRGEEVWRTWTLELAVQRGALIDAFRARDEDAAAAAAHTYVGTQKRWFSSDPDVSTTSVSDPAVFASFGLPGVEG